MRKVYKRLLGYGKMFIICIIYIFGKIGKRDGVEVIFEETYVYNFKFIKKFREFKLCSDI